MNDLYGRPLRNIRISVTDICNLRCYYCHNEGQSSNSKVMTPEEIERVLELARKLGITGVKFTGGEPLLRKDILDIVRRGRTHMKDVSMTTNGAFPTSMPKKLNEAGLNRINISLDSFDRGNFKSITGEDKLEVVVAFINSAIEAGLFPVKINIVALSESRVEDLMATVEQVWKLGAIPQLIELVDLGDNGHSDLSRVEEAVSARAVSVRERAMHRRKIYSVEDSLGDLKEVELVRPMHNTEFCGNCSRIRVMSSGYLKPCLMHNQGLVDILTPMREGASFDELLDHFRSAVNNRYPYWRN